jgi:hypothetical protein
MTLEYVGSGLVSGGKFVARGRRDMEAVISKWGDCEVEFIIAEKQVARSLQQSRWYRGPVLNAISEKTGSTTAYLHEYFKILFNPVERVVADPVTGEIVNIHIEGGSTKKLPPKRFSEFCEQVRQWAAERLDLDIPDADPRKRTTR